MKCASDARHRLARAVTCATVLAASGCRQDMHDQRRVDPYEENPLIPNETSGLLPPGGTVPWSPAGAPIPEVNPSETPGGTAGGEIPASPLPLTLEELQRGRQRFEIYCAPCHGLAGYGDGPVAQRGFFPRVANLHDQRLRDVQDVHIYGVITNGFNAMPAYAAMLEPHERWLVVGYVRALQYSQHAPAGAGEGGHGTP